MDAQVRDPSDADKTLSFYTKDVRVKEADDGDGESTKIEVPVSGLAEDRDGDKLADAAIDSMVAQINEGGVPMFPNHGYDSDNGVPQAYRYEDIIGGWTNAERDGDVVMAEGKLREGKESAAELEDLLRQSLPVGFSIGFGWSEGDAEERDGGGMRFEDMDLMEISPVGIQSHPDASTSDGGVKVASALAEAGVDPDSLDHKALADQILKMADDNEEDDEEQNAGGGGATQKVTGEEMDNMMNLIEGHMEALQEDLREMLEVTDGGEESEASDGGGDDDEEMDEYGEDDEEDDKAAELAKELEEVRAELEAVKTDAAGSAGRKGGIQTTEKSESEGEQTETNTETRSASVAEQAAEF
ncbi:prohead protease [Halorubrum tailed virus 28]|uniref:Prohead protease n=1 Tax=Halorubrum tailed virus 28 TaxID=2878009 RepID=A0AAE9BZF6_9CAUD|nr:prohead protease [Halorubrum tailed virus 28]UBF23448.1 prohead protease [Halorubrum tailed virus 28]